MELFCECFYKLIVKYGEEEDKFYSTGIIFDDDLYSPDFTAMGNIVLIRSSIANHISIWDFHEKEYKPVLCCNKNQDLICKTLNCNFVDHKRFHGTKSRKGYVRTRWKFGKQEFDLVMLNVVRGSLQLDQCPLVS